MINEFAKSLFQVPAAWDRYWFTAAPSRAVSMLRVAIAFVAVLHFVSFFTWVPQWLSGDGWFDMNMGRFIIGEGEPDRGSVYRWSILFWAPQPWVGFLVCAIGLVSSLAALLGLGARVAPLVAWACMLTIHHRAPWLSMPGEILLTASLFYLIIDPGRTQWTLRPGLDDAKERITANLALRCSQIHLLIWLMFSWISMLQYAVWWNGSAVSLLSRQIESWYGQIPENSQFGQASTLAILSLQIGAIFFLMHRSLAAVGLICLIGFAGTVAIFAGDWLYALTLIAMGTSFLIATWPRTDSHDIQ